MKTLTADAATEMGVQLWLGQTRETGWEVIQDVSCLYLGQRFDKSLVNWFGCHRTG